MTARALPTSEDGAATRRGPGGRAGTPVTIETGAGPVRGLRREGVASFLGIPYARPPLGADRLRPPRPVRRWTDVLDAGAPGPWPPQNAGHRFGLTAGEVAPHSEDCLTVNVWTPSLDGDRPRPVLVWLHGGGFVEGSGASRLYDGWRLAAGGDVVVVTGNYRLGLLGFAAHEALRDAETGACGNWGLLDQVLMLRWVRANAAAFGGDREQVTLVGHSAGAMSVCDLMTSRRAAGLFDRAVAQSGGPSAVSLDAAAETVEWVLSRLGLDDPRDLRRVSTGDLLRAQRDLARAGRPFATRPVIDGTVLERHPLEVAAGGADLQPVPLVIGTTREEVKAFYAGTPVLEALTERALLGRVGHVVGTQRAGEVVETYRRARAARGAGTSPGELFVALETDRMLRVPATRFAERHARVQPATYLYRFDLEANDGRGAGHGVEIPLLFGCRDVPWVDWDPATVALSARLQRAWWRWARGETPAGVDWPAYDAARRTTRVFAHQDRTVDAADDHERAAWSDAEVQV